MAEEKLERANFYGAEKIISGRGGAAGGSGGGGLGLTGGAYVPAEGGITTTNRWLRFDFNNPNHKSLIILGGTSFTIGENIVTIDETTSYNLSDYISEEGADYYVFINADGRVVASQIRTPADGYMFIGQFHTLCNGVPANTTGLIPTKKSTTGDTLIIMSYFKERDLDFYNFYTKTIDANRTGSYYNLATVLHPLQGFNTGDILPESVWCLNFHPDCKSWDGMVYCNSFNIAVDIYLQSGTSEDTASEYGAVHTVSRPELNHWDDFYQVGKGFLNIQQFMGIAQGSNELTTIEGNVDHGTTGGHVDVNNRRMVSFIGCEDCCGYIWQWIQGITEEEFGSFDPSTNPYTKADGQGSFGSCNDNFRPTVAGGEWSPIDLGFAGSRCFAGHSSWLVIAQATGGRGRAEISIV